MKQRAQWDDVHESDEELRFFSQPAEPEPELSLSSSSPGSLSPTSRSMHDESEQRPELGELSRFEARRDMLRRRVALTLCGAVAILILAMSAQRHGAPSVAREGAATALSSATLTVRVSASPSPSSSAKLSPSPSLNPSSDASPSSTPTPSASAEATALITKARSLLRTGHTREGVAAARDALSRAPQEAEPYVLLGAGLQDLGDYKAARQTFAACVQKATQGPSASCRYFARF